MVPKQGLDRRYVDLYRAELVSQTDEIANVVGESIGVGVCVVVGDVIADGCREGVRDGRRALRRDGKDVPRHSCNSLARDVGGRIWSGTRYDMEKVEDVAGAAM